MSSVSVAARSIIYLGMGVHKGAITIAVLRMARSHRRASPEFLTSCLVSFETHVLEEFLEHSLINRRGTTPPPRLTRGFLHVRQATQHCGESLSIPL
jgi:hypothetical protein